VVAEGWGGADSGLMSVVAVTLDAEVRVWRVGEDSSLTTVEGGGPAVGRQGGETVVTPPRPRAVQKGRKRSAAQRSLVSSCE
jgi:hypothetical protein